MKRTSKIKITENRQREVNPKDIGLNQTLHQIILTSQNQPEIPPLHILQPPRDPQRVSGRQPNMAYVKTMDPAIHRIMDVKSVDNFYHQ